MLGISREQLLTRPTEKVSLWATVKYFYLVSRRARHTPLAYILGTQPFYGLSFTVNKHTLIPRPETERLVEEGLQILNAHPDISTIIDVGTGSGAIAVSIAKNAPNVSVFATDISRRALKVARANAIKHGVNISFIYGNGVSVIPQETSSTATLVVANLPYIPQADYLKLSPDVQQEPRQALVAGSDGLLHYRALIDQLKSWPHAPRLLFECDPSNAKILAQLVKESLPTHTTEIATDYQGLPRYVFSK